MVKVKFYSLLSEAAGLKEDFIPNIANIGELIQILRTRYGPRFTDLLFLKDDGIKPVFVGVINDHTIDLNKDRNYKTEKDDVLKIFSGVFGG